MLITELYLSLVSFDVGFAKSLKLSDLKINTLLLPLGTKKLLMCLQKLCLYLKQILKVVEVCIKGMTFIDCCI